MLHDCKILFFEKLIALMVLKNLKIFLFGILLASSTESVVSNEVANAQPNTVSKSGAKEHSDEFLVTEKILKIKGDPEFGEYLSGDCTACHQINGDYNGIPSIIGWDEESFVWVMHEYKEKYREHPVMQMMAGRLANDEIAALAAYFATLE